MQNVAIVIAIHLSMARKLYIQLTLVLNNFTYMNREKHDYTCVGNY